MALGNSETTGPDGQTVPSLAWSGTTWAVSGNAAVNTPNVGADVIVNGGFDADTDWTKGGGWTIAAGIASFDGGANTTFTQTVGTIGRWYQLVVTTGTIGTDYLRRYGLTGGIFNVDSTTYTTTGYAYDTALGFLGTAGTSAEIDNVSIKQITTADLFSSVTVSTPNVIADVNVTWSSQFQAGLVVNLDSDTAPTNYVAAFLSTNGVSTQANLVKWVAGTPTSVIAANITYSAGAQLRVIKDGTSYSLYYNGAQVGSTSTISDAGIVDNVLHGMFSTSANNSLDGFTLWARGANDEYATLDNY